jgi:hypothetical protein
MENSLDTVLSIGNARLASAVLLGCFGSYMVQPIPDKLHELYQEKSWTSCGKIIKFGMLTAITYLTSGANFYPFEEQKLIVAAVIAFSILVLMDVVVCYFDGETKSTFKNGSKIKSKLTPKIPSNYKPGVPIKTDQKKSMIDNMGSTFLNKFK